MAEAGGEGRPALSAEALELLAWGADHGGLIDLGAFLRWRGRHPGASYLEWRKANGLRSDGREGV